MQKKYTWRFDHYPVSDTLPVAVFDEEDWFIKNTSIPFFHFHDTLEITYWIEGSGCFTINGVDHDVSQGDLCVICPNALHFSFNRSPEPSRCKYLYIDLDRFLSMDQYGFRGFELLKNHTSGFRPVLSGQQNPDAVSLLLAVFKEVRERSKNWQASSLSLIGLLLTAVLRAQDPSLSVKEVSGSDLLPLVPALDMIKASYERDISGGELAEACHMSDTNFRRIFRKTLQMSPMKYLRQVRIQKACEQLLLSADSVSRIARNVGFGSVSSFNRDFKQTMRVSPNEWRRTHKI